MRQFPARGQKEFAVFEKLDTPARAQNFLDSIPINFELDGETCRSPLLVLKNNKAHCIEGAMLAAAIGWWHGRRPLLMDLRTARNDEDHVVALFKKGNCWGAVSKTNHAVLRYRDPVYRSVRELAMSYFNEYFLDNGKKTLRSYSAPFNVLAFGAGWLTSRQNLWHINDALDASPHFDVVGGGMARALRRADPIEIQAGTLTEWKAVGARASIFHKPAGYAEK